MSMPISCDYCHRVNTQGSQAIESRMYDSTLY